MRSYAFYVEDDRYKVPTLLFVTAADDAAARRLAAEKLAEPHHLKVEVRDGEELLFSLPPPPNDQPVLEAGF